MTDETKYTSRIALMDDADFVKEVEEKCWLSAFAANNPRSAYHGQVDACYDEAKRREKPWLYQRGWNAAYRSEGYQPSESDIKAAMEPNSAGVGAE
jgi:hypothetical protein